MKPRRYKLLLDENLSPRERFPILNNRHNLRHLVQDFKQGGINDIKVYDLAVEEKRLILTFNRKDFEKMSKNNKSTGIISASTNVSDEQIDKKVTSLLSRKRKNELYGKFHHITL